jgi:hypothetical protein
MRMPNNDSLNFQVILINKGNKLKMKTAERSLIRKEPQVKSCPLSRRLSRKYSSSSKIETSKECDNSPVVPFFLRENSNKHSIDDVQPPKLSKEDTVDIFIV